MHGTVSSQQLDRARILLLTCYETLLCYSGRWTVDDVSVTGQQHVAFKHLAGSLRAFLLRAHREYYAVDDDLGLHPVMAAPCNSFACGVPVGFMHVQVLERNQAWPRCLWTPHGENTARYLRTRPSTRTQPEFTDISANHEHGSIAAPKRLGSFAGPDLGHMAASHAAVARADTAQ